VVVHDLYSLRPDGSPAKANAVLIVDADAVLAGTVALQSLEAVAWRNPEVVEPTGDLELSEFASSDRLDGDETPNPPSAGEGFGVGISERDNHATDSNAPRA
jgi:hypothetical protein